MKKTALIFCAVLFVFLAVTPRALAYGGGGGFPPGYFSPAIACKSLVMQLPFGGKINVPYCLIARNSENNNLSQRMADFMMRVKTGNK
jgi:hypothetical protein